MTDYFALLGVQRGPKVDGNLLKARFLGLSNSLHPDHLDSCKSESLHPSGTSFAEINVAYQCLRDPKERLAHLIEIELGLKPQSIHTMPNEIASVGAQVMTVCRGVDGFLRNRQKDPPPMVRARQFKESMTWLEQCDALETALAPLKQLLDQELEKLDDTWHRSDGDRTKGITEEASILLDRCYRLASYLTKWKSQIKERQLTLSL